MLQQCQQKHTIQSFHPNGCDLPTCVQQCLFSALRLTGDLYVKCFMFIRTQRLLPWMALTYTCALVYFTFAFSHPSFCAFLVVYLPQSITQHSQLLFTTCEIQACSLFPLWPLFLHTPFIQYLRSPLALLPWLCSGIGWGQPQTKCFSEFQENQKLFIVSVQIIICICHLLNFYQM